MDEFLSLGLNPQLQRACTAVGYTKPTPIQEKAIPLLLQGHDLLGIAQTGTGKTAAYALPILMRCKYAQGKNPRALILAPTRELVMQIHTVMIGLAQFTDLRILALYGGLGPKPQIQALEEGIDIHALTASEMFNVPLDQMTPDIRRQAKAINFGVIYGISGFGLARNLRIPRAEAQGFIDRYFERFPGIRGYMDRTVKEAQAQGFVTTLFGRRINTPDINAKGPTAGFAKRAAINAPIQGTAADVIRRAMIRMPAAIADLPATMLLQVHDELLFEVEAEAAEALIATAKRVMEGAAHPAVSLKVPLIVEAGQGLNWAAAH